ncbi:MAG TPA: Asp-tRNA(Asn)/Glu-tRNA(Gln) amidotransferase subunit GatB [Thermoanaerobacterales bacterium]|nr:Asp-tRNA(Asn)/Glu-tRNA(Gln) amidotransferase subunit GatB [Thermoanaerobacterales bacterium]
MKFETVVGLEVHVELSTKTKIFCGCSTEFGKEPNSHCCPICLGMPGALPVMNKSVVEYATKAGLALNCEIADFSRFDRKAYFYPDLPKGYQISQFYIPLARNGHIEIETNGHKKNIGIRIMHMEEDAGKLIHEEGSSHSLVDLDRAGVPLVEIVSEPDIRSGEEAWIYLNNLKSILQYIEVSDCKMEEGSLRCDINISLRPEGSKEFGTKVEVKNLGSFRAVRRAIEYEEKRQKEILEDGGSISQETRRWDEARGITTYMRGKVENRYSLEPNLAPIIVYKEWKKEILSHIPELPNARKTRFMEEYGLPEYDASVITASKILSNFYEECVKYYNDTKAVSNWIMVELMSILNETGQGIEYIKFTPKQLSDMLSMIDKGTISGKIAKDVFREMFSTGKSPEDIVKEKGLVQISDESQLETIAQKVIDNNPKSVQDYKSGKERALGFLVGQIMKETRGKANPQMVNQILKKFLG